jgi:hypothetical protein
MRGGPDGMPGPGRPLPSLSFTFSDGLLLLGIDDFVRRALDRDGQGGLASSDRFRSALEAAGADNAGMVYVDLAAVRALIGAGSVAGAEADIPADVRQFINPLSRFITVTVREGDELVSRTLVYVE